MGLQLLKMNAREYLQKNAGYATSDILRVWMPAKKIVEMMEGYVLKSCHISEVGEKCKSIPNQQNCGYCEHWFKSDCL